MRASFRCCFALAASFVFPTTTFAASSGCVALTFDDGPSPKTTPRLLDILEQAGVRATFFVVGRNASAWPAIVKREAKDGDQIGNHSWDHPVLTRLSGAQVRSEIDRTDSAIERAAGLTPALIRAPYGALNARVRAMFSRPFVSWDDDTMDWKYRNAAHVYSAALRVRSGQIVLMHDIRPTTVEAVPKIIEALKSRGFEFATVSQLRGCSANRRASSE